MALAVDFHNGGTPSLNLFLLAPAVAILLVLYIAFTLLYNIFFHPLSSFPGPKSNAATRIPYVRTLLGGRAHEKWLELHNTYGNVVRIAPNELSFITPTAWKDIYGHRQGHHQLQKNPKFYNRPANNVDTLITANDADHSRFRRLVAHAFSDKALREQEAVMKHYVDLLINRLVENSASGKALDMVAWYNWTTFDLIGDLAFGESFDCLKSATYHPWVSMIFSTVKSSVYLTVSKQFTGGPRLLKRWLPAKLMKIRQEHIAMTVEKVRRRLQLGTSRPDFMSHILRYNDEKGMSEPELISNASLLIVAGSETTATLLSGCTFQLLKNPDVLQKLVTEVRTTFKTESDINLVSVNGLKYMLAVLEESFRMYPPVPAGLPRVLPEEGDFVDGKWLPGGTVVAVQQWAAYQSPQNFKHPTSFIPERWLDDPQFASDNKSVVQPFSIGPRNCIGRNLAYAEMRLILARVLWNFDLKLAEESNDWANQKTFNLWEKGPLMCRLTPVTGFE